MTQFEPSLHLNRMIIERRGRPVYDELFHSGVNIIRGDNSSGKSTILNFIHYALGGDVSEWSETALLCDRVTVEVKLSGKVVTLSRPVESSGRQPMDMYFGSLEKSASSSASEWTRFPYQRSPHKESFSQAIFRLLNMPEAAEEETGNITMHQVLRLLYADQLSPIDEIFLHHGWDDAKLREAVGKLLCGAFDAELYANQLEMREVEKKFDVASAELNSLFKALGQAGQDLTLNWVEEQRARNEGERLRLNEEAEGLQTREAEEVGSVTIDAQEDAYKRVVSSQQILAAARENQNSLEMAIADSAAFVSSLEEKLQALKDAALVANEVGSAEFSTCPACYAEVPTAASGCCALCKEPVDLEIAGERIGSLINDTALQLRQSRKLQEHRVERLRAAQTAAIAAFGEWQQAAKRYEELQKRPTTQLQYQLGELYKRLGYLDRRDEDLNEKAEIIAVISSLSASKVELNTRLSWLKARNEQLLNAQGARLAAAYLEISNHVRLILSRDLKRQDTFENPQRVDFSFSSNRISVDGHTYFSASSRAILKSAFFLGFHAAASNNEYFRHPRFLLLDTIEDKGMEASRSQNFQRVLVDIWAGLDSPSQIIFGTAMLADELDTEAYTVGRFYTREHRSLDVS